MSKIDTGAVGELRVLQSKMVVRVFANKVNDPPSPWWRHRLSFRPSFLKQNISTIKIPVGPVRESNPGPRAPEALIIPLDQQAIAVSD